ncbi:MAG: hypothetical protein ACFE94_15290 [Candidatus Hodarchaeota archaeon]
MRVLELGCNKIKEINGLEQLVNLERVSLVHKKINHISGMEKIIDIIDLDGNPINQSCHTQKKD